MRIIYKIIIISIILLALLLTGVLAWRVTKEKEIHIRQLSYRFPDQEEIQKKIKENISSQPGTLIPKVVYITYHDLDRIPDSIIENLKKYRSLTTTER